MCRLLAYSGRPICAANLIINPNRSIIRQSFDCKERITGDGWLPQSLNGDGFGLAWYSLDLQDDPIPCVYRDIKPAWNDYNLTAIAEKVYAKVMFAHVRAASLGMDVGQLTCHPFQKGRFSFMHNGGVADYRRIRRVLVNGLKHEIAFHYAVERGSSDSAVLFAVFLDELLEAQLGKNGGMTDEQVLLESLQPDLFRKIVLNMIRRLDLLLGEQKVQGLSLFNMVFTDGVTIVATRYSIQKQMESGKCISCASLYYATGSRYEVVPGSTNKGEYEVQHDSRRPEFAMICSEPLSDSLNDWIPVPIQCCIVVTACQRVLVSPIVFDEGPPADKLGNFVIGRALQTCTVVDNDLAVTDSVPISVMAATVLAAEAHAMNNLAAAYGVGTAESSLSGKLLSQISNRWATPNASPYLTSITGPGEPNQKHMAPLLDRSKSLDPRAILHEENGMPNNTFRTKRRLVLGSMNNAEPTTTLSSMVRRVNSGEDAMTPLTSAVYARSSSSYDRHHSKTSPIEGLLYDITSCKDSVFSMAEWPGKYLFLGTRSGLIFCWDVQAREMLAEERHDTKAVFCLIFDSNACRLYSGSAKGLIKEWEISIEGKNVRLYCANSFNLGRIGDVYSMDYMNGDLRRTTLFIGSGDMTLRALDITSTVSSLLSQSALDTSTAASEATSTASKGTLVVRDTQPCMRCNSKAKSVQSSPDASPCNCSMSKQLGTKHTRTVSATSSMNTPTLAQPLGYLAEKNLSKKPRNGMYHCGAVYAVCVTPDNAFVCSGAADGFIRVWDAKNFEFMDLLEGHSSGVTALLGICINREDNNTSVKKVRSSDGVSSRTGSRIPSKVNMCVRRHQSGRDLGQVGEQAMYLVSGSIDCSIRVWDCNKNFVCKATLYGHSAPLLSLVGCGSCFASGDIAGDVLIWCSKTLSRIRKIRARGRIESLYLSRSMNLLFAGLADGGVHAINLDFVNTAQETTLKMIQGDLGSALVQGGADDSEVQDITEMLDELGNELRTPRKSEEELDDDFGRSVSRNRLIGAIRKDRQQLESVLREWVSFPSVSGFPAREYRNGCWDAAEFACSLLEELGAVVRLEVPPKGSVKKPGMENPLVWAKFLSDVENAPTIFVYGHYDVCPAQKEDGWETDPWTMTAKDGCLYGRGTTDNKGPILAMIFAVRDLLEEYSENNEEQDDGDDANKPNENGHGNGHVHGNGNGHAYGSAASQSNGSVSSQTSYASNTSASSVIRNLRHNIVFALEGHGETRNEGFREIIQQILESSDDSNLLKRTRLILKSNSYWIGNDKPCLNYGLRGVIDIEVSITGPSKNLHGGLDGGAVLEPTTDLAFVLASLKDARGHVNVPGFWDHVKRLSPDEERLLSQIGFDDETYREQIGVEKLATVNALKARWTQPCLSITSITTSNLQQQFSVLPQSASAKISIRTVPNQSTVNILDCVRKHIEYEFNKLNTGNKLSIKCRNRADWWVGDYKDELFQFAAAAIEKVWNEPPLYVREGGTMPVTTFLSELLRAPVVQIPLGQANDNPHLPNEKIRAQNLWNGKDVFKHYLKSIL
eukprot:CAMPEP_0184695382 /NCGR_PEP_ID=MMETSP0313-20130426/3026_1 /TAXON_ID=2792 /ORGANISM="Porphyridium aerugineum, Strain SAG 1380-2" /LENGTH=1551 /DNA_ID=CAMNT_0027153819 /DNA_START=176 /DNA_END=4831 /DNA_ORIENTATION=-